AGAGKVPVVSEGVVGSLGIAAIKQVAQAQSELPAAAQSNGAGKVSQRMSAVTLRVAGIKPVFAHMFGCQLHANPAARVPVQVDAGHALGGGRKTAAGNNPLATQVAIEAIPVGGMAAAGRQIQRVAQRKTQRKLDPAMPRFTVTDVETVAIPKNVVALVLIK